MSDDAVEVVRAREEERRRLDVPLEQELADLGGGHDEPVRGHGIDDVEEDAAAREERPERVDARTLVTGREVVADHHVGRAEVAGEVAPDELGGGRRGVREVERLHHRRVHPVRREQLELAGERCEERRRELRAQDADRVGLEGEHRGAGASRAGPLARDGEEPLVPEVDAVEVADRDGAAAQRPGGTGLLERAEDHHPAAVHRAGRPPRQTGLRRKRLPKPRGRSAPSVVSTRAPRAPARTMGSPGPPSSASVCRHAPHGGVGSAVPVAIATASRRRAPAATAAATAARSAQTVSP